MNYWFNNKRHQKSESKKRHCSSDYSPVVLKKTKYIKSDASVAVSKENLEPSEYSSVVIKCFCIMVNEYI